MEPFDIRKILKKNTIPALAKPGQISQSDVIVPAGQTDIPPEGTSFFQALNIPTKIQKGQIEILNPIYLLKKGQIIGNSEALLLQKLNIVPFSYELKIKQIFDFNYCYDVTVLDIEASYLTQKIIEKIREFLYISSCINYPYIKNLENAIKISKANLFVLAKVINYF